MVPAAPTPRTNKAAAAIEFFAFNESALKNIVRFQSQPGKLIQLFHFVFKAPLIAGFRPVSGGDSQDSGGGAGDDAAHGLCEHRGTSHGVHTTRPPRMKAGICPCRAAYRSSVRMTRRRADLVTLRRPHGHTHWHLGPASAGLIFCAQP